MSELRAALEDALGPIYRVEREVRPVGNCRLFVAVGPLTDPELLVKVLPGELSLAVDGGQLPLKLAPGERRSFDVHVTRSGALLGSTYVMGLVASGTAGERHFAERVSFTVRVVAPVLSGRTFMGVALAGLVVVSLLLWMRKNRHAINR